MRCGAAAGLRRRVLAAVLTLGLGLAGCEAEGDPAALAAGWHPVSPPPEQLPSGHMLWVNDELVMFSSSGGPSFAYRPRTDTWRPVTPPAPAAPRTQWAMVSTGTEIVALTESATAVYSPDSDVWRSLPPAPAKGRVNPEMWFPSVAWTGREVAVDLPGGDDVVALDVARGRWRSLPRIGIGPERSSRIFATTSGLVAVVAAELEAPSPTYLLRPSAGQWRPLPDLPGGMTNITSAGNHLFAGGTRPGTHMHDRGRYLLPEGSWEPLPPAPVLVTGSVSVADGVVALWHGTDMELAERPNGALLRPGRTAVEAVPPPPHPIWGGALVSAGDDFLLLDHHVERPPGVRLLARLRPPPSGEPWPPAEAVPRAARSAGPPTWPPRGTRTVPFVAPTS